MKRIILVVLLLAVSAYAVYTYWPLFSPYFVKPAGVVEVEETEEEAVAPAPAPVPVTEEAIAEREGEKLIFRETRKLVDPFSLRVSVRKKATMEAGPATPPEPKPEIKLEGVWISPTLRAAFISGQVMTEGSIILGWRVERIFWTEVWLRRGGRIKILKMEGR